MSDESALAGTTAIQRPDALPIGWAETTLGEAFRWGSGGTPLSSVQAYYDGEIPWAIIGDLDDGIVNHTQRSITPLGLQNSSAKLIEPGHVLVAMYGSIGKLGISGVPMATNQAIAFTKPDPIDGRYLFWYLRSIRDELFSLGKGGTQRNISQTVLKSVPFPVAPLPEQRRIVAEIETQFTRLDAAVAALERARANLKRYRAAVLASSLSGHVLNDSPIMPFSASNPMTIPVPATWNWLTLAEVSSLKGGITKGNHRKPNTVLRTVPYLRVANVQRGWLDLDEIKTIEATEEEIARLRLQPGDVLFNEGGDRDKLGRGWVWEDQIAECIHQNHVFRARVKPGILLPKFLSHFANTFGQPYFMREGKQTTNLASINLTKLGALPVPVPPIDDQVRIVEEVERQLSVCGEIEATISINLKRAERMRQSILRKAFAGQLVPQDHDDEPASVLLERLREERAEFPKDRPKTVERRRPKQVLLG